MVCHSAAPSHPQSSFNVAVLNVGAPAAGMNAAVRSAVRVGITEGHKMFAVNDGFEGLYKGQVSLSSVKSQNALIVSPGNRNHMIEVLFCRRSNAVCKIHKKSVRSLCLL